MARLLMSKNMSINTADKCQRFYQNKFARQVGKRVSTHMSAHVSGKGASACQDMSQHTRDRMCQSIPFTPYMQLQRSMANIASISSLPTYSMSICMQEHDSVRMSEHKALNEDVIGHICACDSKPVSSHISRANRKPKHIKSNLWSMREKTSAMAVELEIIQQARMTLARSPPGTTSESAQNYCASRSKQKNDVVKCDYFTLLGAPLKTEGHPAQTSNCRRLIVDTALETSGAPVHELNGTLRLDGGHGCVHILWHHISLHAGLQKDLGNHSWTSRYPHFPNVPTWSRQIYCF